MAPTKTRTYFVLDVLIAIALLVAGVTAAAFLVPYSAIDFATSSSAPTFLGLDYGTWRTMHLYSGLAMVVGGLLHFALHWGWMARVAKGMLPSARGAEAPSTQRVNAPAHAEEAPDAS